MKPVEHYRTVLETRLAELEKRLHTIEDSLEQTPDPDAEERATEREGDEVREELGNTGLDEIRAIRAALDRMEEDEFGACAKCGNDISEERLEVVPHAALCRDCAA